MITAKFKRYQIKVLYNGDLESPFAKGNFHSHSVTVSNINTKQFNTMIVWGTDRAPRIVDKKGALRAFGQLLQVAMIGALDPEVYCDMMHLDPEDEAGSRPKFEAARDVTGRMYPIILVKADDNPTLMIMKLIKQLKGQGIDV